MIFWGFHILHLNSAHLPVTHNLPSLMQCPPKDIFKSDQNKTKQENKQNKQTKTKRLFTSLFPASQTHLYIHRGSTGRLGVSYSTSFCPISFISKCSLQWVTGLALASGFLNTIIIGSSLELSRDILWPPQFMEIFWALFPRTRRDLILEYALPRWRQCEHLGSNMNRRVGEEPNGKHWPGPLTGLGQIGISDSLRVWKIGKTTRYSYYREENRVWNSEWDVPKPFPRTGLGLLGERRGLSSVLICTMFTLEQR